MSASNTSLMHTPLHAMHIALGARLVPFAGYEMPVQFPAGVLKEHVHTRTSAGLFDVSHMGQVLVSARDGGVAEAARALEALVGADLVGLAPGRQRYGVFTNEDGGILDDLMVANLGEHLLLVVNAACKQADIAHLRKHLDASCEIDVLEDRALLALQGPAAVEVLASHAPSIAAMRFMDVAEMELLGVACTVARAGYTGEDGCEISVPADKAAALAEALLADSRVQPIGLGARDSLRLEAGLCLYGNDIDTTTSPTEGGINFAIGKARRSGGARAGGFPGADRILAELEHGAARRRVGLQAEGRAPVRSGAALFADAEGGEAIGHVTSGGFGPSAGTPVAMGYVPTEAARPGESLYAEVRNKRLPTQVVKLPFVDHRYSR